MSEPHNSPQLEALLAAARVVRQLPTPELHTLEAYARGELDAEQTSLISRQLAVYPELARAVELIRTPDGQMSAVGEAAITRALDKVAPSHSPVGAATAFRAQTHTRPLGSRVRQWGVGAALAAGLGLLLVLLTTRTEHVATSVGLAQNDAFSDRFRVRSEEEDIWLWPARSPWIVKPAAPDIFIWYHLVEIAEGRVDTAFDGPRARPWESVELYPDQVPGIHQFIIIYSTNKLTDAQVTSALSQRLHAQPPLHTLPELSQQEVVTDALQSLPGAFSFQISQPYRQVAP